MKKKGKRRYMILLFFSAFILCGISFGQELPFNSITYVPGTTEAQNQVFPAAGVENTGLDVLTYQLKADAKPYIVRSTVYDGAKPGIIIEVCTTCADAAGKLCVLQSKVFPLDNSDNSITFPGSVVNSFAFGASDPDVVLGTKANLSNPDQSDLFAMVVGLVSIEKSITSEEKVVAYHRYRIDIEDATGAPSLEALPLDCNNDINLHAMVPYPSRVGILGVAWPVSPYIKELDLQAEADPRPYSGHTRGRTCYNPNIDANLANGEVVITWSERENYVVVLSKKINRFTPIRYLVQEHTRGNVYGAIGWIERGCFGSTCPGSSSCRPITDSRFGFGKNGEVRSKENVDYGLQNCIKYFPGNNHPPSDANHLYYYDPTFGDAIGVDNELERKSRLVFTSYPDVAISEASNPQYPTLQGSGSVGVVTYAFKQASPTGVGLVTDQRYHNYVGLDPNFLCGGGDPNQTQFILNVADNTVRYQEVDNGTLEQWANRRFGRYLESYFGIPRITATPSHFSEGDLGHHRNFVVVQSRNTGGCDDDGYYTYGPIKAYGRVNQEMASTPLVVNALPDITLNRRSYDPCVTFLPSDNGEDRVNIGWSASPARGAADVLVKQFSVAASLQLVAGHPPPLLTPMASNGYSLANYVAAQPITATTADPGSATRNDGHLSMAGRHIAVTHGGPLPYTENHMAWETERMEVRGRFSGAQNPGTAGLRSAKGQGQGNNETSVVMQKDGTMKIRAEKGQTWQALDKAGKPLFSFHLTRDEQLVEVPTAFRKKVQSIHCQTTQKTLQVR